MTIEIKLSKHNETYCEILQQLTIQFAWAVKVKDDVFQCQHKFVNCRDFLPDFHWMLINRDRKIEIESIYGFIIKKDSVPTPYMALNLLHGSINNLKANMEKFIPASAVRFVDSDDDNRVIVEWSEEAKNSPWRVSLFTFLLKLCCVKEVDTIEELIDISSDYSNEAGYYLAVTPKRIIKILNNWDKLNDPEYTLGNKSFHKMYGYNVHNHSGFVAMFGSNKTTKLNQQLKALT